MKKTLLLGLSSFLLSIPVGAQALTRVRVDTPDARQLASELELRGFDVVEGSVQSASLELVVSAESMTELLAMGYEPEVIQIGRPFSERQAEEIARLDAENGPDAPPAGYSDLAGVLADMQGFAAAFPAICQYVDLTATYGTPATFEGRHLFAVKISDNVNVDEDEPAALIVSNHHAREITTPVIALHAIEQLTSQYGSNPTITQIVNSNEIWIAPVWNPDGYQYVFDVDELWRKNRRIFPTGIGVDQNRNYPFGWSSNCAGSTNVNSDTYKGPSPASEAETQTLMAWSQDVRFAKVIDYHTFGPEALYEYLCSNHPLVSFFLAEAQILSQMSGYGATRPPSAEGEEYQWQLATFSNHAFLIEAGTSFQPSFSAAQAQAAQVFPGITWMLQRPISVTGRVTDAQTGLPVQANVTYKGINFLHGETNPSDPDTGRYHAFLPVGPQILTFAAPGYRTQSIGTFVSATTPWNQDVVLQPNGFCPTATVFTRNRGVNPNAFTATAPVVGQNVTLTVNTSGFQFATIFGMAGPAVRPVDAGWVLIDLASTQLFMFNSVPGPVAQRSLVVAPNTTLCGMYFYTQARLQTRATPRTA